MVGHGPKSQNVGRRESNLKLERVESRRKVTVIMTLHIARIHFFIFLVQTQKITPNALLEVGPK